MPVDNRAVDRQCSWTESANTSVRWWSRPVQCSRVTWRRRWTWILRMHFTG